MNFLISPDSFKGSLSADEVAKIISDTIKQQLGGSMPVECVSLPISDGGEGTAKSITDGLNGEFHSVVVKRADGKNTLASYGIVNDEHNNKIAVIEMAQASGIILTPKEINNPMQASSYGTGEMIKNALDNGVNKILLGIGGSATNDGGSGMMQALGIKFLDKNNNEINSIPDGLKDLHSIDTSNIDQRLNKTEFILACDVTNPILGEFGATAVYGPQKGVDDDMQPMLENILSVYVNVVEKTLNKNYSIVEGSGAGGGIVFSLLSFMNTKLHSGIDIVLDTLNFDNFVKQADVVITGEGKTDIQTMNGKAPSGIAVRSKKYGKPVFIFSGIVDDDWVGLKDIGVVGAFAIKQPNQSLNESMKKAGENLKKSVIENLPKILSYKKN